MHAWSYQKIWRSVDERTARFGRTTAGADFSAPVPTCPGWTIGDLVRHHGTSQRRITVVLRTRAQEPVYSRDLDVAWPAEPAAVGAWYETGRTELLDVLERTDPCLPVWTNSTSREAGYWARRILHEAVIHGADAEVATGTPVHLGPVLAADGIEEFLDAVRSQPAVAERVARLGRAGREFDLVRTDRAPGLPPGWRIMLRGNTFAWRRTSVEDQASTRITGTTGDLLLLVYGRAVAARLAFEAWGDRALVDGWLKAVRW